MISLCKVLLEEIALLVDTPPAPRPRLLKIINGAINHFNSALYFASTEMPPHFLLSFISHSILLRTKTPETSAMFCP